MYTIIADANSVKDQNEDLISAYNTTTVQGYMETKPVLDSITPSQIKNVENQIVLITGSDFESGTTVYLDTLKLTATIVSNQIKLTIPAGTKAGVYDLILKRPNGEQIKAENAVVVEDPEQTIEVLSDESYASPKLVPNDGETTTTMWVRVSDPDGVSDIDTVYIDLRPIDGSPAEAMQAGSIVDTKRWYSLEITVPETVSTSDIPISLEVIAQNKVGDKAYGKVNLTVNNNITSSIAPKVEQAYSAPSLLTPGSDEDVYFYAYVTDEDGANTLNTVIINLGTIGGAPMVMEAVTSSSGTGMTSFLQ